MNIIMDGVRIIMGLALTIIIWMVLSNPFTAITTAFNTMDAGEATTHLDTYIPLYINIAYMAVSLIGVQVVLWIIFRAFQTDPQWYYR